MPRKAKTESDNSGMSLDELRQKAKDIGFTIQSQPRPIERISTGIAYLDYILGGGFPRGRSTEIYGPSGTGKSTIAMLTARQVLLSGGRVVYLDIERAVDVEWAMKLGVPLSMTNDDGDYMMDFPWPNVLSPSQEQWLSLLMLCIKSGRYDLIIVDTFGAMASNALLNADMTKGPQIGVSARNFTRYWQLAINPLAESGSVLLVLNQERVNIGDEYHPVVAPGGKAHEHSGSVRIETYAPKTEYTDKERTTVREHEFRFYVRKNKISETRGKLNSWFLIHDLQEDFYEVDQTAGFVELAKAAGIFEKSDGSVWEGKGNCFFNGTAYGFPKIPDAIGMTSENGAWLLGLGEDKIKTILADPEIFEAVLGAIRNPERIEPEEVPVSTLSTESQFLHDVTMAHFMPQWTEEPEDPADLNTISEDIAVEQTEEV
jgi:RecA/RadA recombinase